MELQPCITAVGSHLRFLSPSSSFAMHLEKILGQEEVCGRHDRHKISKTSSKRQRQHRSLQCKSRCPWSLYQEWFILVRSLHCWEHIIWKRILWQMGWRLPLSWRFGMALAAITNWSTQKKAKDTISMSSERLSGHGTCKRWCIVQAESFDESEQGGLDSCNCESWSCWSISLFAWLGHCKGKALDIGIFETCILVTVALETLCFGGVSQL